MTRTGGSLSKVAEVGSCELVEDISGRTLSSVILGIGGSVLVCVEVVIVFVCVPALELALLLLLVFVALLLVLLVLDAGGLGSTKGRMSMIIGKLIESRTFFFVNVCMS